MDDFFEKAIDPHQYDTQMNWEEEGSENSPTRKYFRYYLLPELDVRGKSVVDIGCGVGHMVRFLEEKGANEIVGFDPSEKNIKAVKTKYPNHTFLISTLEDYPTDKKFDVAVSIMVFEHIKDLKKVFKKVHALLNDNGLFYLIVGDKDYSIKPRMDYELEVHQIDSETFAAKTKRLFGVLYDIFRPTTSYTKSAEDAGFLKKKHIPIVPNDELIELIQRYKDFKGIPTHHLFIFQKTIF